MVRERKLLKNFLTEDSYHTDPGTPRLLLDKMAMGTRWSFIARYIPLVLESRRIAKAGKYDYDEWISSSLNIFRLIESCGGRFHLTGLDNIKDADGPVVFISNHMSTLETMIFPGIIAPKRKVTFVVKDTLIKHAIFGPTMRSREPIVVTRTDPRADFKTVIGEGKSKLEEGISVVIFPQSTRTVEFSPEEFSSLGVKLAKANNVSIIPVAIKTDFWGNAKFLKAFGPIDRSRPIHMHFGNPMKVTGTGKEEHTQIVDFILTHLKEWDHSKGSN
jgi:1-acyl-sn-glycerol-3-phosphate acyltransferase